jgi:hypothetical protein
MWRADIGPRGGERRTTSTWGRSPRGMQTPPTLEYLAIGASVLAAPLTRPPILK